MEYIYNTPEEAIISLEKAYSNKDLENVIASKDFETEAKLMLQNNSILLTRELIQETSELLRLSLIEHIQNNGYPNFNDVKRVFSSLSEIDNNLYVLDETLNYTNGESYTNKIMLTNTDGQWKVVMTK
ncbi:hypothetical protein B0A58_16145 [Flavobacterium branchiophilum NBRC 15030 = ATCC 35035]|uniref:Lumazine-binding protein n=1 Tax=Flavobacterium branchiophilum TaxID=55197 RepID=A0A543FZN7_9FLAO|nr:hypothetical protein [Flavobacterium branchiophilum]OXA65292.1 hypothetical protein B0A58_16145 [Flavobacterium branchiophilum NBRC 15030 = ATCC 35035]TQM39300.1 hypothetical protein BC670_0080 [Flavobacterium branchiophilum]GEM54973.1 hypothetical protein FB1_11940 [Flavobacterium branchiophilum NBRC 15030 = ATCC 35035]